MKSARKESNMELGFLEYLVTRKRTGKDRFWEGLTLAAFLLAAMALCVLLWILLTDSPAYAAVLSAAILCILYVIWRGVRPRFYVEYEYCVVSDQLTVDRIYGQSRRKRIFTLSLRDVTGMARPRDCMREIETAAQILDFSTSDDDDADRVCLFYPSKKEQSGKGSCIVVLTAPEDVRKALKRGGARGDVR